MEKALREAILNAVGPALSAEIKRSDHTPFKAWLAGEPVAPVEVLAHASTFAREDGFIVVKAMASTSMVEAALFGVPIDYSSVEIVWRCVSLQHIPADIALAKRLVSTDDRPLIRRIPELTDYAIISLARTDALDAEGRRVTMTRASESTEPLKTALAWFAMDLSLAEPGPPDDFTTRWAERWAARYSDDTDAGLLAFRAYLASARRIGVIQALAPLRDTSIGATSINVEHAAWGVAWDEASRAKVHRVCAELALERARGLAPDSNEHIRWTLLYALHRERILRIPNNEEPVARELLDLFYQKSVDDIAAQLACSIAIKSNRFDPILREALPVMRGPVSPVTRAAYSCVDRPRNLAHLITSEPAGALVALRMLQSPAIRERLPLLDRPVTVSSPRATLPPIPILDDYETNSDLMQDPEIHAAAPRGRNSIRFRSESSPLKTLDYDELTNNPHAVDSPVPTIGAIKQGAAARRSGHFDSGGPNTGDVQVGPPPHSEAPTEFDVLLVTNLPEDKRERADSVLAARLKHPEANIGDLLPVLDEHAALLPQTVQVLAHRLVEAGDPRRAALFFEHAARAEVRSNERSKRYAELGDLWLHALQSVDRALEYYIVSFTCDPTNPSTLQALRDLYLANQQFADLLGVYRVAIQTLREGGDDARIAELENDLRTLQAELSDRSGN